MRVQSQFIEMFGNPVTNSKSWQTKAIMEVAPEQPSKKRMQGKVWLLNLDMIESNTGKVIEKVYETSENTLSVQPFDEGNVLFSKLRPYLNKVVVPDEYGLATTELVPLRPNQEKLHKVFLSYLLRSQQFVTFANKISGGTKMPRMPLAELRKFECILPPMSEQLKFVGITEQADKSKFDGFKSQFIEMFYRGQYKNEKLKSHIEVIRGVSYKPTDVRDEVNDSSAVILRSNNIDNGEINLDDLVYVDKSRVSITQIILRGDIIMCGSNGSKSLVGKAAMIDNTPKHMISFGAFCLCIRCKETINPMYLSTFFQTSIYRDIIEELGSGSNILNIKPEHIYNIEIPIPSIIEQNKFISIAEQADKSKFELRKSIDAIDQVIKSLING